MRISALIALMLLLSGCEAIRDIQLYPKIHTANAQMASAIIDCDKNFPPRMGNYVSHARCINAAQDWVLRPHLPYPDLLSRAETTRLLLSAKADRGEIDEETLNRLSTADDNRLTLASSTLDGPLTRYIPPDYAAPPPKLAAGGCTSNYSFSDCNQ